jgi:glyoxylase-like metal-dependent hydrolase (beta-lactamase superfamily II)
MDQKRILIDPAARADDPEADHQRGDGVHEVAPDIAYMRIKMVNVAFIGLPGGGDWFLVDAGVFAGSADAILHAAEKRFGVDARPGAILMTHGHFDHIGGLEELANRWKVPVWCHPLETPYMNGAACYPPADPAVGGGMMAFTSPMVPRTPIDVSDFLQELPDDGSIPGLSSWQWVHTPGHTPGHVSFWRDEDRSMVVGDAFVTTDQESIYAVITQKPEMQGPPMYFTQDWDAARESVRKLTALDPEMVVTGHGRAMRGALMRSALRKLAENFDEVARPNTGVYIRHPASPQDGSAYTS